MVDIAQWARTAGVRIESNNIGLLVYILCARQFGWSTADVDSTNVNVLIPLTRMVIPDVRAKS